MDDSTAAPQTSTRDPLLHPLTHSCTQTVCAGCTHVYVFGGRPRAEDAAEELERAGWEFQGQWFCQKCKEAA